MTDPLLSSLSDRDLLIETERAAASERVATKTLVALLAELDSRRLYLAEGFSSLFVFATQRLHLSEPAAYSRITAARAARRFPLLLTLLDDGAISLTIITVLAAHLTDDNHVELLDSARHKSKREVERLIAALHPQPDIASSVRALPTARADVVSATQTSPSVETTPARPPVTTSEPPPRPPLIAPIAPRRYLIRLTISEETHAKLQRARDLLRHVIPSGDPAEIVDRALTALLQETERRKTGATVRPRPQKRAGRARGSTRHVPASIRRAVWARDQGRCAFVGPNGRCGETSGLEFHHVVPFAAGGPTTAENLQLRCRAHNAFEGEQRFGDWRNKAESRARPGRNSVRTELFSTNE